MHIAYTPRPFCSVRIDRIFRLLYERNTLMDFKVCTQAFIERQTAEVSLKYTTLQLPGGNSLWSQVKRNSWQSTRAIKELRYHYLNAGELQTDQQFVSFFPFLLMRHTHTHRQTDIRTHVRTHRHAEITSWYGQLAHCFSNFANCFHGCMQRHKWLPTTWQCVCVIIRNIIST